MDQAIQEFIKHKNIAVVGASRQGNKFGNMAGKELQERGYNVFYIHPDTSEIDGQIAYPNLKALNGKVDTLWVSVPAEQGTQVIREASDAGVRKVWLQQGGQSPELLDLGRELDLEIVHGKCILMYAEPVRSFHKFHQVIWKLIGQY